MDRVTGDTSIEAAVRRVASGRTLVLAVSGGLDSMVLLHVAARVARDAIGMVATFDHGTGPAATSATHLVAAASARLALPCVIGRSAGAAPPSEAQWRVERFAFLRDVAARAGGIITTAHTRDDQVETVLLRLLRGSGPRGLAALAAPPLPGRAAVLRPWLEVTRQELEAFVAGARIRHVDDPSNHHLAHARNRVRRQLLPALRAASPGIDDELLTLGRRAAGWRRAVDGVVATMDVRRERGGGVSVARGALRGYSPDELGVLWPAVAARAGVCLDRRGTRRLAMFTSSAGRMARVPLAGGAEVVVLPERFLVRRRVPRSFREVPLSTTTRVAGWHLRIIQPVAAGTSPWVAALPTDRPLTVRSWQPGDRIHRAGSGTARRVKRFLAEAGIPGPLRAGWPVVLAEGEIVWIPGVCRSDAATARPGRPAITFRCERYRR